MNRGGDRKFPGRFSRWLAAPNDDNPDGIGRLPDPEEPGGSTRRTRVANYDAFNADYPAPQGPDDIRPISDDVLNYIEEGHAAGASQVFPKNSEFPHGWTGDVLRQKVQQVVDNPQGMDRGDEPRSVELLGLVDGISVRVPVRDTGAGWQPWAVWTAFPDEGAIPGVS